MDASDRELIDAHLQGSQEAFATLVRRHLDLVYSAARRQTQSPTLAEDVTQAVFLKLSRLAGQLKPGTPLPAWLYTTTRHAAIDLLRQESRRLAREHTASEIHAMHTAPSPWTQVEPLLDEAMAALPVTDRDAVLHRYFANKSMRDVGVALGISDDAAQKRVSRALDQLRTLLAKRGVAVTAGGLATDLSAHAIEAAPITLGTTISAGVITAVGLGTAAIATTQAVIMTTLQKTVVTVTLALTFGAAIYTSYAAYELTREHALLGEEMLALRGQFGRAQSERRARLDGIDLLHRRLAEAGRSPAVNYPATENDLRAWLARETQLRQTLAANPSWQIPELELLTPEDWGKAAETAALDSPEQIRQALADLRTTSRMTFGRRLQNALRAYATAHNGDLPPTPAALGQYFDPVINPAILSRYEMLRQGKLYNLTQSNGTLWSDNAVIGREVVDPEYDTIHQQSAVAGGWQNVAQYWIAEAKAAYAKVHGGAPATDATQLHPYVPSTIAPELLARSFKP